MNDFFAFCLLILVMASAAAGVVLLAQFHNLNTKTWKCTDGYYTNAEPPYDRDYVCTQYGRKEQSK